MPNSFILHLTLKVVKEKLSHYRGIKSSKLYILFLRFAYTDKVKEDDLTTGLLSAADKYDLPTLFNKCQLKLCTSMTVTNAAERYLLAFLHEALVLKETATKFIINNYDAVKKTAGFTDVLQHPKALLNILY